jgi:DNA repair exonuclease SbcCD nuclease subunit
MFNKALEYLDFEEDKTHVIFAHQEFMGAKMGAIESHIGDIWPEEYPTVISGHIHDYQILGNVIYAGTPFQHGFSDSIDKKLMIVTITTENIRIKRKKLNVTRKKSLKLTLEEFENFTPLENCITKVYIQGDSETIRQYLKANKERLEKYDLKVCIRDTSHSECDPEEKRISFEEYLKSKLGDELYLRFEEIMSTK